MASLPGQIGSPENHRYHATGVEPAGSKRASRPDRNESYDDGENQRGNKVGVQQANASYHARWQPQPVVPGAQDTDNQQTQQGPDGQVECRSAEQVACSDNDRGQSYHASRQRLRCSSS